MITVVDNESKKQLKLSYDFTSDEISLLARFLRDHQEELPHGLEGFNKSLEDAVYNTLSLEEARLFYS